MTVNSLAPGFLKVKYLEGTSKRHVQILPVKSTTGWNPGDEPTLDLKGGGSADLSDAMVGYTAVFADMFGTTNTLVEVEAWKKPLPDDDPLWIYTHPVGEVGNSMSADAEMTEFVMTYRTSLGGIFRQFFMESIYDETRLEIAPYTGETALENMLAFMTGNNSFIVGRDGGWLVSSTRGVGKINDALRKKYFLGT